MAQSESYHQPPNGGSRDGKPRVLLIVDDDPRLCRMLSRRLESSFDELHTANTPADTERKLQKESVTYLICDFNLGEGSPQGTDLIAKWRSQYPSTERAVLFASTYLDDKIKPVGVDALIYKTTDFKQLMEALNS
jgi:DNA-binding response OmpR family regulator